MLPSSQVRPKHGASSVWEYLRKVVKYPQMDIDYTFWQILYLCVDPRRVYKNTSYHKQTKNQWARDDPAFVVILIFFIVISAISYSIAFNLEGIFNFFWLVFGAVFLDFLFLGGVIATLAHFICNHYLRSNPLPHGIEQKTEWFFCFDVHCNAFLPIILLVYSLQYLFLPLLMAKGFLPALLSNLLYVFAFSYYHYITFLGYKTLPFLNNPRLFLYPIPLIVAGGILFTAFGFNSTRFTLSFYFPYEFISSSPSSVVSSGVVVEGGGNVLETVAEIVATAVASAAS